ncbi:hypothetical protein BSKO_02028 [Bryopsis sp. KO-2023]|nr:hypothetical protein BSKO_02028 [Bryopsis sp. KO-2023]
MGQCLSMGAAGSKTPQASVRASAFKTILDQYESIGEVQDGLRQAGLESSQMIIGIDFTKSNEWTGKSSFNGQSLHSVLGQGPNLYEQGLSIIAKTLAAFDDDNLIPCYGFGDNTTGDRTVFSFFPQDRPANGLQGAVLRYRQIAPYIQLAGPTSFAPLIRQAMRLVVESEMQYHILVIIADGQVTPTCMQATVDAIVSASKLPLSIIMVGVGDGPWDQMEDFDDNLPARMFDNFQFLNFGKVMEQASVYGSNHEKVEAHFAVHALMEIPEQFSIIQKLGLMQPNSRFQIDRNTQLVLPPPPKVLQADQNPGDGASAPSFL